MEVFLNIDKARSFDKEITHCQLSLNNLTLSKKAEYFINFFGFVIVISE